MDQAILDMKAEPRRTSHEKCTSNYVLNYVLAGRLRTAADIHLLQKIDMSDLRFRPDPRLQTEMDRLQELEKQTLTAWGRDPTQ